MEHMSYADAGVDVDEGARAVDAIKAAVASTNRPEVIGGLGGFGSLFSAAALKNMEEPVLVSGTDGVGTKLALAQRLGRHNTVGQDLVAMCVDDIVPMGAEPLFFLDYVAIGKLEAEHVAQIVEGIATGCKLSGCALVGGEMAEHPGVMKPQDFDLAGFVVGVVDRPRILGPERVEEGDVIVGLPSSGIHSNGYSLVRSALTDRLSDEELLAPQDFLGGASIADAVMEPTRIYAGNLLKLLADEPKDAPGTLVHAMAHITGGGITENLNRALPKHLDAQVTRGAWDVPAIIKHVSAVAQLTQDEAYKTFNMGMGMALLVPQASLDAVLTKLVALGENPFVAGTVIAGTGKVVYV